MISEEILYQKAQDSAEHNNTLMWHLIYIGFGLSLWINYTVALNMSKGIINTSLHLILIFFGSITFLYFSRIIEVSYKRKISKWKFSEKLENKPPKKLNLINISLLRIIKIIIILVYLSQTILLLIQNKNLVEYHFALGAITGIVIIISLTQELYYLLNPLILKNFLNKQ